MTVLGQTGCSGVGMTGLECSGVGMTGLEETFYGGMTI